MAPSVHAEPTARAGGLAGLAGLAALACGGPLVSVTGTGPVVRESRALGLESAAGNRVPSAVRLEGELDLTVRAGRELAVWIDGHADLVRLVDVALEGELLAVAPPSNTRLVPAPHVEIELPALAALRVVGPGTARAVGIDSEALDLALVGSGDLTVSGVARRVTLELHGSGEVHLEDLAAEEVDIDKVGSGVARVAARATLRGTNVGSGDVLYVSRPATIAVDSVGSGSVRAAPAAGRSDEE